MKRFFHFFCLVILSILVSTKTFSQFIPFYSGTYQWLNSTKQLGFPSHTSDPSGTASLRGGRDTVTSLFYNKTNNKLWIWNPLSSSWIAIQAGGTTGDAWLLASGGTLTGTNTITSSAAERLNFNGTWTATANSQAGINFSQNITGRANVGDIFTAVRINPTLNFSADGEAVALDVAPIFTNTTGARILTSIRSGNINPVSNNAYQLGRDGVVWNKGWFNSIGVEKIDNISGEIDFTSSSRTFGKFFTEGNLLILNTQRFPSGVSANNGYAIDARTADSRFIGGITVEQLVAPVAPVAVVQGTPGSTTITYKIIGKTVSGYTTEASSLVTVNTANAVLSGINSILLQLTAREGTYSYDIYRISAGGTPSTTGKIGTVTFPFTNFTDTGLPGDGTTIPTTNTTGTISSTFLQLTPITTTERDAIISPAEGKVIMNGTTHKLEVWDGTVWQAAW